jgi:hypothetical protein
LFPRGGSRILFRIGTRCTRAAGARRPYNRGLATTKKVFSYDEATALLPRVRESTEDAFRRAEGRSGAEAEAIVQAWARELVALGLEVKGLWLVDFDNGSGYYCWRYPEPGLQYYHSYEDGFGGRMRIQ